MNIYGAITPSIYWLPFRIQVKMTKCQAPHMRIVQDQASIIQPGVDRLHGLIIIELYQVQDISAILILEAIFGKEVPLLEIHKAVHLRDCMEMVNWQLRDLPT